MMLCKADPERRIGILGVTAPVRRPVDIDQSMTGFANLRTLRIYQFDAASVIDGHAEEDEVLIVVLAGSVELTINSELWQDSQCAFTLSAATESQGVACAAYLPPHATYKLSPQGDADVAYARATPASTRPPTIFSSIRRRDEPGITVLLDSLLYAERLRMRLVQIDATQGQVTLTPIDRSESTHEALVHLTSDSEKGVAIIAGADETATSLHSRDTIALSPGDHTSVRIAGGSASALIVTSA